MTLTAASDCTYIQVESTLIDDFVSDQTNKTLSVIANNCSTDTTVELELADLTVGSPNYYRITPSDLSQAAAIDDQLYKITVKLEETGQDTQLDTSCVLVSCELNCDIVDFYVANGNSMAHIYFEILKNGLNNCAECDCDDACKIWNGLQDILNGDNVQCCE